MIPIRLEWIPPATILKRWLVKDGESVRRDQALLLLENCDGQEEHRCDLVVESPSSGVVRQFVEDGVEVVSGELLGEITD
jgi:biotin carboxyl carrier protein